MPTANAGTKLFKYAALSAILHTIKTQQKSIHDVNTTYNKNTKKKNKFNKTESKGKYISPK